MDQVFRLASNNGLSLTYESGKTTAKVLVVLPDGASIRSEGEGMTDVAAATEAIIKAVKPFLDLGDLRIHKTGIKRERCSGARVPDYDTSFWVHSSFEGGSFKGYGRAQFPTAAYAVALLSICNKIVRSRQMDEISDFLQVTREAGVSPLGLAAAMVKLADKTG